MYKAWTWLRLWSECDGCQSWHHPGHHVGHAQPPAPPDARDQERGLAPALQVGEVHGGSNVVFIMSRVDYDAYPDYGQQGMQNQQIKEPPRKRFCK